MPKQIKNIINTNTKANKQRLKTKKTTPFLKLYNTITTMPIDKQYKKKPIGDAVT